MPNATTSQITSYVSDMLAVVRDAAGPLAQQAADDTVAAIPETSFLVPRMRTVIDKQIDRLQNLLDAQGTGAPSPLKSAAAAMRESGTTVMGKLRGKSSVSKMLRDDYTALSLISLSYEMLNATAVGLNEPATAQIARSGFQEVSLLLGDISRTIPAVVIQELREEGHPVDAAAVESTRTDTKKAWSSQRPIVS